MPTIVNAVIRSATLSIEDHNCLSFWIMLDYGDGGVQGFGGYSLAMIDDTHEPNDPEHVHGGRLCGEFIARILIAVGVNEWEKLVGQPVRVELSGQNVFTGKVNAIGHIVKDIWCVPEAIIYKQQVKELKEQQQQ